MTQTHALLGDPGLRDRRLARHADPGLGARAAQVATASRSCSSTPARATGTTRPQYPGLFGWQPSYNDESKIFAKYINATYPGANVCFLGQGDDFGTDGLAGLVAGGVSPAVTDLYSVPALVAIQRRLDSARTSRPSRAPSARSSCLDTIPGATDAALGAALQLGYSPQWVISSVGSDPQTVDAPFVGKVPDRPRGRRDHVQLPAAHDHQQPLDPLDAQGPSTADPAHLPGLRSTVCSTATSPTARPVACRLRRSAEGHREEPHASQLREDVEYDTRSRRRPRSCRCATPPATTRD